MSKKNAFSTGKFAVALAAIAVIAVAAYFFLGTPAPMQAGARATPTPYVSSPAQTQQTNSLVAGLKAEDYEKYPELSRAINQYYVNERALQYRPNYLPSIVYSELPPFPTDFYSIRLLYQLSKLGINDVSEAYWKQPEWIPNFEEQGLPSILSPPADRWGAFGFGVYPSELVVLSPRNGEYNVSFFIYSSWLVQTYQGLSFHPEYPVSGYMQKSSFPDDSRNVTQDPALTRQYFEVTSVTPAYFLVEPSFPIFRKGWIQKITVNVKAKNVPPGRYLIGLNLQGPPDKIGKEWLLKYKTNYVGGSTTSVGIPWFNMFIDVT